MKKICMFFAVVLCLGGMVVVRDSQAAFYKYVDKDGVVCFADDLQVIPEQYRAKAVIVQNESKDVDVKPAGLEPKMEAAPSASEAKPEVRRPRPLSIRLMISAAVGLGAFLIFVVVSRQLEEDKKALSIVRGSLLAGVSIYFIVAHAGDVMTLFGLTGKAVEEVERRSEEKGKKAARAIKSFDALFEEAQKAQKAQQTQEVQPLEPAEQDKDK